MIYTNETDNEFFTDGKFNFEALIGISNETVTQKLKDQLIAPITRISIEESKMFTHIGVYSQVSDVIYVMYDRDYYSFQFNFIPAIIFDELQLKISI